VDKSALIIGSGAAGIQAALDLADAGIEVHLVESSPFLGKAETGTVPPHIWNARLLDIIKHPNIHTWTNTTVEHRPGEARSFDVTLHHQPRYVDMSLCTACGECSASCPIDLPGVAGMRKAIYQDGQPGCMTIDKLGIAPCRDACPVEQRAQGYIALIRQKRYADAYWAIRREHPFPSVCGRVCNHRCEDACTRGRYDEAINIMGLKRFVADWAYAHRDELQTADRKSLVGTPFQQHPEPTGKKIAVIGAGPAGLTAGLDLVRLGHQVTLFDSLPVAGGMMRVGIPPHRLPTALLDWEIQQIINEGVDLQLNIWVDDIPGLLENGYDAALIATGAHSAKKLPIRNSNHPDNWLSLHVLRNVSLGKKMDLQGKRVVVLGGGNVALDTARTVWRLGAESVCMACLEPRGEMPGFQWEISVAEEEGVKLCPGRTFKEIVVKDDRIVGVRCAEIIFHGFKSGRPNIEEIPGSEYILPADIIIWAIGQGPDFSFLPQDGSINTRFPVGIQSDEVMMTTLPGVFVAGDVHRGVTFFVVDAIKEGHNAALNIDQYLRGAEGVHPTALPPVVRLSDEQIQARIDQGGTSHKPRVEISSIPVAERVHNFHEVDLALTEEEALIEAERCLRCANCSECLECEAVCPRGAIDHEMRISRQALNVGVIILAEDAKPSTDPSENQRFYQVPPHSALMGSATAAKALTLFGKDCHVRSAPRIQKSAQTTNRTGVFICQCGGTISQVVDTQAVCQQAIQLPNVVYAQELPFSCSPDENQVICSAVEKHSLNRVVLAGCTCCPMDQVCYSCTYQRVRCKSNLGLFSPLLLDTLNPSGAAHMARMEFVNIREQCARVHAGYPQAATSKASAMVAAAVARVQAAPVNLVGVPSIARSAIILGNGYAGKVCQHYLQGYGVKVQRIAAIPSQVQRAGGQYHVRLDNQKPETPYYEASALVLSPQDEHETIAISLAFGRERRRPAVHATWGGLETHRPGVFHCDPAGDPEIVGAAAAARLTAWLGRMESRSPIAAVVDPERCRACKTCVDACEYGAPGLVYVNGRYTSWIDPAICTGCGTCAAQCPSGAISAGCSTDIQIHAILSAILGFDTANG
jgi:NADPH-dependent glutamate synthase beta subunit-like oxidoreductase/NAD-dependent dihydropyrimidine dehydrogenase PreA subunit